MAKLTDKKFNKAYRYVQWSVIFSNYVQLKIFAQQKKAAQHVASL